MCALTMFAGMLGLYKRRRSIVQHHIWLLTACTRSTVNASHKDQPTNEPLHCARHIGFSPIMTTEIKRVIEHWMMADTLHLGSKNKCSWWHPIIQGKEHIILSLISLTCQAIGLPSDKNSWTNGLYQARDNIPNFPSTRNPWVRTPPPKEECRSDSRWIISMVWRFCGTRSHDTRLRMSTDARRQLGLRRTVRSPGVRWLVTVHGMTHLCNIAPRRKSA